MGVGEEGGVERGGGDRRLEAGDEPDPGEMLGFVGFIVAFVFLFWALGIEGQSWEAIALLAVFLVGIAGYRTWLKRRHP